MFVLFLNPRPQFRVKEHSDSVLPPLSPSAKHKKQNLHTYVALTLHLGLTGCQYAQESGADHPTQPFTGQRLCLSENPAALSRLQHCVQGAHQAQPALSRGEAAPPWTGPLYSHGWAPRGRQLFSQGAGVVDAKGFPNGLRRARHSRPTPGTPVCRAPTLGAPSATGARSPPDHPRTQATRRQISFLIEPLLARPFYASSPPHYKHPHRSPGARETEIQPGARPPELSAARGPLPPWVTVPVGLGALTLERADE